MSKKSKSDWVNEVILTENPLQITNIVQPKDMNIADCLYTLARVGAVAYLAPKERARVLNEIYGDFTLAESFPREEGKETIAEVLSNWMPGREADRLMFEEYRRLKRVLDYQRRIFCLDLEGLVIEHGKPITSIEETIQKIRKKHGIVISTAIPENEAREMISKAGLLSIFPLIFGELGAPQGKKYLPIAEHFGYYDAGKHLVAVSHSLEDIPADTSVPFVWLDTEEEKLANALLAGVDFFDKERVIGFNVTKVIVDLGNKVQKELYVVQAK